LLDYAGIGRERLQLGWISAAEGQLFAEMVTEITELVQARGPFDVAANKMALDAVLRTLETETVRWLMGMQRELTEKENVYGEKVKADVYMKLLDETIKNEYQKSLIYLSLQDGPLSVREIDTRINIGIQNVSNLLTDLEGRGQVELHGYEGRTPKFAGIFL
jgi:predicted Rossmann fold nucleotide-binding protein DprA/Smf involved in DNA uptake